MASRLLSFAPGDRRAPVLAGLHPTASRLRTDALLLALYAAGFLLAHAIAVRWGGDGYYSLWFPAAGLRFALLWRAGVRFTLPVAAVELAANLATGAVVLRGEDWALVVLSVIRPALAYGLAIYAVQWLTRGAKADDAFFAPPMPFALASVAAPFAAALAALPQALLRPELTGVADVRGVVLSLSAFTIGDLLGVLLVAPPLLWVADAVLAPSARPVRRPSPALLVEAFGVLLAGLGVAGGLAWIGLGLQPAPALVAIAWVGLRFGRVAAWAALLCVAAIVLPLSAGAMDTGDRLQLHLGLATIAVAGYLAGSFADAQIQAREDLARRDRLLFQAERLKTLRAMSVAVIHEISQPLSTLSIEARHLHESAQGASPEVEKTAALIHAKATQLSDLVRRLRRYGGRAVDQPTPLPLTALFDSVLPLAGPEVTALGARITIEPLDADILIEGQEVELAQALVNLVRNAAQACGRGGEVVLSARKEGAVAIITVANRHRADLPPQPGMGVGTLVARAILEAHGGTLTRETGSDAMVRATITLPLIGDPE